MLALYFKSDGLILIPFAMATQADPKKVLGKLSDCHEIVNVVIPFCPSQGLPSKHLLRVHHMHNVSIVRSSISTNIE